MRTKIEIVTAERAFQALADLFQQDVEEFWALALGPKKELLATRMLFRGTVDSCLVHPRDIFRFAIMSNASSVLVAHNHPSGDLIPSIEDLNFTRQLIRVSALLEIPLIDHIIVSSNGFASLRQDGWCTFEGNESVVHDAFTH